MPGKYEQLYARSLDDPEGYWGDAAEQVHWYKKWDTVFDDSRPPFYRWFKGGMVNSCYNALDLHVANGRADQLALIYDSPVTDTIRAFTFRELLDQVARFAGVLASQGAQKGDRVLIYMPMVPEAVIAMLACARIGAVHSVVFGGFAANELATRIDDAKPKLIVSASCGIEVERVIPYKPLLDQAIEGAAAKPERAIILQRPQSTASMGCRARSGLVRADGGCETGRLRARRCNRPPLHPLYLRHDGHSERGRSRQRRSSGCPEMEHGKYLRRRCRRGLLGGIGCGLGRRSLLYRLRASVQGLYQHLVRR